MAAYIWFDPGEEDAFTLQRGHKQIDAAYTTLRSYAIRGARDGDGRCVQLEVCKLPTGVGTTLQAYRRFISKLSMAKTA